MTVTLDIPDEIFAVVREEAQRAGNTPEERIRKIIDLAHRFRLQHSHEETDAELDRIHNNGAKPLAELLPGAPKG